MPITADYHMHSSFSGDSEAPMEQMVRAAIGKGLHAICFTEHQDLDYPGSPAYPDPLGTGFMVQDLGPDTFLLDVSAYQSGYRSVKERLGDLIEIRFGVEIGLQPQIAKENAGFIAAHPFDFVIASTHVCDHMDVYYKQFFEKRSLKESILRYFTCTLENLQDFDDFDVYGHLDYIIRYLPAPYAGRFDYVYRDYADVLEAILDILVKKDKGLDINTSHRFKTGGPINPSADILKRFKEKGGRLITFGSDAHAPDAIAGCFSDAALLARSAGFTEYCTFANRTPQFHPL